MKSLMLLWLLITISITSNAQRQPPPYVFWAHWWFPWPKYITTRNIISPPHKRAKIRAARRAYRAYRKECETHE